MGKYYATYEDFCAVRDRVVEIRNKVLDNLRKNKPDNSVAEYIYDTIFAEYKPLLARLPEGWVYKTNRIFVTRQELTGYSVHFDFNEPKPWPLSNMELDFAIVRSFAHTSYVAIIDHGIWGDSLDELKLYIDTCADISKNTLYLLDALKILFTVTRPLKELLEIWPSLWLLLPDRIKNKYGELDVFTPTRTHDKIDVKRLDSVLRYNDAQQ